MDTYDGQAMGPRILAGRYELGRLLGAGGMAEVYEGHDRLLARRVAVKILLAQYAHDPAFLERFRREAQAAAALSHPNIVSVYDTGSDGDIWFIVMELVAGNTLRDLIHLHGPVHPARAAEICSEVAGALAVAHARGIVHRDVKPGNVMLTTEGKVKVMDFGIARATAVPSITQTSAVVGTAQYISPEQAQGLEADPRSDLYSLGCCLYEMVTGQVPFTGPTPVAIAYRHIQEDPTPPRALNANVPGSLERVCLKAMAKRPEDRYQTALDLQRDLERVRLGEPVTAAMPRPSQQTTRAMGTVAPGPGDRPTTVLDRTAVPSRSSRYGAETAAPPVGRPRRGRAVLFALATILLTVIVAWAVVRAVQVPATPSTTLPPVSTEAPPPSSTEAPTTSQQPTTTEAPTTAEAPTTQAPPTTAQAPATTAQQGTLVQVPDTRGMRANRATDVLHRAGLEVARQNVPVNNDRFVDRVIEQVPRDGQVPRGTTVTIVVGVSPNNG
jgi:eukaryotic-like serine/threonine-protein kinase